MPLLAYTGSGEPLVAPLMSDDEWERLRAAKDRDAWMPHMRVLVVEDEPAVRQLVSSQLESLGYEVTAVASGPEALQVLSLDDSFDLLFTDLVMPGGVSGVELARRVRRAFGSDLKVLLTSGYPQDEVEELWQPDTDMLLLRKPYRRQELEKAVQEALGPRA